MMWSTLTMVFVIVLAVVSLVGSAALCAMLLWTSRRMQGTEEVKRSLDTLRREHQNLDEIFESYRKRDAQRVSSASQRRGKQLLLVPEQAGEGESASTFDSERFRASGE